MAKLTILKGLPGCGKTTLAKKILTETGNTVRVNKDALRLMLNFDKYSPKLEGDILDAELFVATTFLSSGKNVIVDDTNLNPRVLQKWIECAKITNSKIEYKDLTPEATEDVVKMCIERDFDREKSVGRHVIQKMALQYLGYMKEEKVIIVDIDGTVADCTHRKHFLDGEKKDWKGFFSQMMYDTPRDDIKKELQELEKDHKIIFVSARPEDYRMQTMGWILSRLKMDVHCLIMREKRDRRPDTIVKGEMYDKYLKGLDIVKVYDDRPSVIRMWQEKGLIVKDVGDGIEF